MNNQNPTTHRFVAILNRKVEPGRLMNALGHMAAGFSNMYSDKEVMRFDNYFDKDGGIHPSISDNPFIVLSADNSNQIRNFRNTLKQANIIFNDFTSTMVVGTFVEQKEQTAQTSEIELEYYGICCFGPDEVLKPLTKKFSLWR